LNHHAEIEVRQSVALVLRTLKTFGNAPAVPNPLALIS